MLLKKQIQERAWWLYFKYISLTELKGKSKVNVILRPAEQSKHTNSSQTSPHFKAEGVSVYNRIADVQVKQF